MEFSKWWLHDDVIVTSWLLLRYWPYVRGIHRWPMNSPHKGRWRGALMFSLIFPWTNGWVNTRDAGDLRSQWAHYDVTVMAHRVRAVVYSPRLTPSQASKLMAWQFANESSVVVGQNICKSVLPHGSKIMSWQNLGWMDRFVTRLIRGMECVIWV